MQRGGRGEISSLYQQKQNKQKGIQRGNGARQQSLKMEGG